jgi:periplasmic divalent cation tolerance protein
VKRATALTSKMFGLSHASRAQLSHRFLSRGFASLPPGFMLLPAMGVRRPRSVPSRMINDPSEPIVVLLTAPNNEEAGRIAETLVSSRLAACVQILPEIRSIYRWKGEIARESEVLLLAKTTRTKFTELEQAVRSMHSYETPEIVALQVLAVSDDYLEWLKGEVAG